MSTVPQIVTRLVDDRDDRLCRRCGISLTIVTGSRHHRQRRAIGGHVTSNLVLLCGSGSTGCHGWVHSHPLLATSQGLIVPSTGRVRARFIPILSRGSWWLLDDMGHQEEIPESQAIETLVTFGLRVHGGDF